MAIDNGFSHQKWLFLLIIVDYWYIIGYKMVYKPQ